MNRRPYFHENYIFINGSKSQNRQFPKQKPPLLFTNQFATIGLGCFKDYKDTRRLKCYNPTCRYTNFTNCVYCRHLPLFSSPLRQVIQIEDSDWDSDDGFMSTSETAYSTLSVNGFNRNVIENNANLKLSDFDENTQPPDVSMAEAEGRPLGTKLDSLLIQLNLEFNLNKESEINSENIRTGLGKSCDGMVQKLSNKFKFKR